jgi:hypothetical protein
MGPQVVLQIETTNEAAKKTTEDDLRRFWEHISPTVGDRRAFIRISTPVPGDMPWANINRVNLTGQWELEIQKNEFGVDAEPYYFMDKIDRTKSYQQSMVLTLPVVNRIVERLKESGWNETYRSEDLVKFTLEGVGLESFTVDLMPGGISLQAWHKEDSEIFAAVDLLTRELGVGSAIKDKMQSVIGSPEYFRGNRNGVGVWIWRIGDYDVMYTHHEHGRKQSIDSVSIDYKSE